MQRDLRLDLLERRKPRLQGAITSLTIGGAGALASVVGLVATHSDPVFLTLAPMVAITSVVMTTGLGMLIRRLRRRHRIDDHMRSIGLVELPREEQLLLQRELLQSEMPRLTAPITTLVAASGMLVSGGLFAPASMVGVEDDPMPLATKVLLGLAAGGFAMLVAGILWLTRTVSERRHIRRVALALR